MGSYNTLFVFARWNINLILQIHYYTNISNNFSYSIFWFYVYSDHLRNVICDIRELDEIVGIASTVDYSYERTPVPAAREEFSLLK